MNNYLVKISIRQGEETHTSNRIVRATRSLLAAEYGMYSESYTPESMDWSEGAILSNQGEVSMTASATRLKEVEFNVMSRYLTVHTANVDELLQAGNYKEYRHVEPVNLPTTLREICLAQCTDMLIRGSKHGGWANFLYLQNLDGHEIPKEIKYRTSTNRYFAITSKEALLDEIGFFADILEEGLEHIIDCVNPEGPNEFDLNLMFITAYKKRHGLK